MSIGHNKFTVAQRLLAVESELADLRKLVQNIQLKEGLQGRPGATGASGKDSTVPGPAGRDGKDAIAIPGPAGRDGRSIIGPKGDRGLPGRDGKDSTAIGPRGPAGESIVGPQGIQGERGDVLIPNESELAAAVQELRLKLAKWQAAVAFALEQNGKRQHSGLKTVIEQTLKSIELGAR